MLVRNMTGYTINDVPTVDVDEESREMMKHSDSTQESLMAEAVIAVNESDEILGPVSKFASHNGIGQYHRAFSVLLFCLLYTSDAADE